MVKPFDFVKQFENIKASVLNSLKEVFPFKGKEHTLQLARVTVGEDQDYNDYTSQVDTKVKGRTWGVPVYADLVLKNNASGKVLDKVDKVRLFNLPQMTPRGSFIVKGNEYSVTNELLLRPGVYTIKRPNDVVRQLYNFPKTVFHKDYDLTINPKTGVFTFGIGQAKVNLYAILKGFGIADQDMQRIWGKEIFESNKGSGDGLSEQEIKKLYEAALGKATEKSVETLKEKLTNYFKTTIISPETTKVTLGKSFDHFDHKLLLEASGKLLRVQKGEQEPDDRESIAFKEFHSVDDFIATKLLRSREKIVRKIGRNIDSKQKIREIISLNDFNAPIESEFVSSQSSGRQAQYNPVSMVGNTFKTTIMGEHGIQSEYAVSNAMRSLHPSHLGFLDPIHTPEGEGVGSTLYLPTGTKKVGNALKARVINKKTLKEEYIEPIEFSQKKVAFSDQYIVENGKLRFKTKDVKVMEGNRITYVPAEQVDYILPEAKGLFTWTTNLIPFLQNDQGNRAMMASQHIEQAVPLVHREQPLVQSQMRADASFEKAIGQAFSHEAPVAGVVKSVKDNLIAIKDASGKTHKVNIYRNFPLNDKTYFDSDVKVSPGDTVKKGDLLADTNYTKDGVLAIGVNLKTAMLPYKGWNVEDGIVITESAANKLSSQHMYPVSFSINKSSLLNKSKYKVYYPLKYTSQQLDKIDENGLVKVGTRVQYGDPLFLLLQKMEASPDDMLLRKLKRQLVKPYKDFSKTWDRAAEGEVVNATINGNNATIFIKAVEKAQIGDKIAARHGNKGIITKIIADAEAPKDKAGAPVEVLFNPHGIVSRMNPGQLLEGAYAKAADKNGKPLLVNNFTHEDYSKIVKDKLKESGLSDKEELFDPDTGKSLGKIFVGKPYTLKLFKQSETNLKVRDRDAYDLNRQPVEGGEEGGKKIDLLTLYSMLAHGATHNLKEMATIKSEQNDEFWRALQFGQAIPVPKPTFAYDKFTSMLKASGVNVTKDGTKMILGPLTDKEILKMSNGEIADPKLFQAKNLAEEKGGLFDPTITGGKRGELWAHITLAEPLPNPVFEKAIKSILDFKKGEFDKIVAGELFVNKEGKIIADKKGVTGGKAIELLLDKIDVDSKLKEARSKLKEAPKDDVVDYYNGQVRYLEALKTHKMKPSAAYMLHFMPVIPPIYRPMIPLESGDIRLSPANDLYKTFHLLNKGLSDLASIKSMPDKDKVQARTEYYKAAKALVGLMEPENLGLKNRRIRGFITEIAGKESPKEGFFQDAVITKRQDLVARGTIIPDPNLNTDEVAIPEKALWKLYKVFIIRDLIRQGFTLSQAEEQINNRSPLAQKVLEVVTKERPVLLNRAPSLHKFSMMAFHPQATDGNAIKIPPIVVKGFGADFDGDEMNIHVPVTDKAVKEAYGMMPSKHLYNPGSGELMLLPSEAAALGIYLMSRTPQGREKLNNVIRSVVRGHSGISKEMNKDEAVRFFKDLGEKNPSAYTKVIDRLKKLGDLHSYNAGFSVGLENLDVAKDLRDKTFAEANKKLVSIHKGSLPYEQKDAAIAQLYQSLNNEFENKLMGYLKSKDNPFYQMVASGAKGKKSNLKQMLGAPVLVEDYDGRVVPDPITKSYAEGLPISQYWSSMYGARKGMIDRKYEVSKPGQFNKTLLVNMIKVLISMDDCKTTNGIDLAIDDRNVLGRVLPVGLTTKSGTVIARRGSVVDSQLANELRRAHIQTIKVRSPMTCEAPKGVCAKCYGLKEDGHFADLDDNVGAIAGQAMGEPLSQMTMKTFHTGGSVGRTNEPVGFEKIDTMLKMPDEIQVKAPLAEEDGKVQKIAKAPAGGFNITVNDKQYYAPHGTLLKVKVGSKVLKGEPLSTGLIKAQELADLKGLLPAQKYIAGEVWKAYQEQGTPIKKKIIETVLHGVGNTTKIIDPGTHPDFARGDVVSNSIVQAYNKVINEVQAPQASVGYLLGKDYEGFKKGELVTEEIADKLSKKYKNIQVEKRAIKHKPYLVGMNRLPFEQTDWMSRMGHQMIAKTITEGAGKAWKSDVADKYAPIPALAYGAKYGEWNAQDF